MLRALIGAFIAVVIAGYELMYTPFFGVAVLMGFILGFLWDISSRLVELNKNLKSKKAPAPSTSKK